MGWIAGSASAIGKIRCYNLLHLSSGLLSCLREIQTLSPKLERCPFSATVSLFRALQSGSGLALLLASGSKFSQVNQGQCEERDISAGLGGRESTRFGVTTDDDKRDVFQICESLCA